MKFNKIILALICAILTSYANAQTTSSNDTGAILQPDCSIGEVANFVFDADLADGVTDQVNHTWTTDSQEALVTISDTVMTNDDDDRDGRFSVTFAQEENTDYASLANPSDPEANAITTESIITSTFTATALDDLTQGDNDAGSYTGKFVFTCQVGDGITEEVEGGGS